MAAAASVAVAAMIQALKASGVVVRVAPEAFLEIVGRMDEPLIVYAPGGSSFLSRHAYLTSYKGLAFYCQSRDELSLPPAEIVLARSIWIPG